MSGEDNPLKSNEKENKVNNKDETYVSMIGVPQDMNSRRFTRLEKRAKYNRWCILLILFCVISLFLLLLFAMYTQRQHCDESYKLLKAMIEKNVE